MTDLDPVLTTVPDAHICAEHVHWHLNLQHFGNTNIKYLEVTGACKECGTKVSFRGHLGVNPSHPTVSFGGFEATFPFLMESEEYDGRGIAMSVSSAGDN